MLWKVSEDFAQTFSDSLVALESVICSAQSCRFWRRLRGSEERVRASEVILVRARAKG